MALLETHGLGKDYGDLRAVDALDLKVEGGEIFGLLGPNGAGKTTAISMIAGVVTPTRGGASVGGHDIRREPFAARAELGLVPQEIALYEELTASENLHFFGSLYGVGRRTLGRRIDWALEVAGLTERSSDPVHTYSGGMQRRLNLAAGLLHDPRLLILDEPTVGVDPQSRKHLFDTIRTLADEGIGVLYTSHYMEEVQALCRRVGVIDHGALIALDSVANLVSVHGSAGVEIGIDGDAGAALAAVRELGEAVLEGQTLRIKPSDTLGAVIRGVEEAGARVAAVRTLEANLETVFLSLTGQALRDGEA